MPTVDDPQDPEAVLAAATDLTAEAFGPRLVASYAIGSLAHGGFCPLVSDVDLAVVLADPLTDADGTAADDITAQVRAAGALAARLSLFWTSPATLTDGVGGRPGRLPALDRLDLARHGRVLRGGFDLATVALPSTEQLIVEGVEFALEKLATDQVVDELHDPARVVGAGARHLTKRVLFPVRFLYTAATGELGRNEDAIAWYVGTTLPARDLVARAGRWRTEPVDEEQATRLVADGIVPLYDACIDEHRGLMGRFGRPDLADALRVWQRRLHER